MRIFVFTLASFIVTVGLITHAEEKPQPDQKKGDREKVVKNFMRKKLDLSAQALEGIVTEDFAMIEKAAVELDKMSHQDKWEVYQVDEYNHFSAEYRRASRALAQQAIKKNIEGAGMAYTQLTMSCIECHKFSRGARVADADGFKRHLNPTSRSLVVETRSGGLR